MRTPFNILVTNYLLQGTRYKAKEGPEISISGGDLADDERVLFFEIDENGAVGTVMRQFLDIDGDGQPIADLIVYYRKNKNEHTLIITEAKGKDFDHAADQIINTYKHLKKHHQICENGHCRPVHIKVCCVSSRLRGANINSVANKAKDKIIRSTGLSPKECGYITPDDFLTFIRGMNKKQQIHSAKLRERNR